MKKRILLLAMALMLIGGLTNFFQVFYFVDKFTMDSLYQTDSTTNKNIKIIAIDEKTLNKYGPLNTWSRVKTAELIKLLNGGDNDPAAICVDVMFIGGTDSETDSKLVEACKLSENEIMATNLVYQTVLEDDGTGNKRENSKHISMVEKPYDALLPYVSVGFATTFQDKDSYIRISKTKDSFQNESINSLSMQTLNVYSKNTGKTFSEPKTDVDNYFLFQYTGKPGKYETVSLCDVLDGTVNPVVFKNNIAMLGAYAAGMQDAYNVPIDRGAQMYGVEIHANIIQAVLEGKTALNANALPVSLLVGLILGLYYILLKKMKIVPGAIIGILICIVNFVIGKLLFSMGLRMGVITLPILIILVFIYQLIKGYVEERLKRKKVVDAFKKYVAPQVVDEISKRGNFELKLGGEKRDIAVLFVDIRGFTPMSESLQPEQVVEILNEYLELTTNSIFNNGGTLDKFIGDATMAVFNAPFDLEDYVYKAVCTARDIAAGSEELEKRLMERFGKSVSFGIGVNCGPGVVGNIGCNFRMDYTAIGDTVNTAARLESNAKKGQILISEHVYERIKDRIEVTEIGEIPLKGKSLGVMVYSVDKVNER